MEIFLALSSQLLEGKHYVTYGHPCTLKLDFAHGKQRGKYILIGSYDQVLGDLIVS